GGVEHGAAVPGRVGPAPGLPRPAGRRGLHPRARPVPSGPDEELTLTEPTPEESRRWAVTAAKAADEKLASDVVVLEVGQVLALCDFFVIASAPTDRQVKAICDEVERQVAESGGPKPKRIEGLDARQWVLMD